MALVHVRRLAAARAVVGRVCASRTPRAAAIVRPTLLARFSSSTHATGASAALPAVSPTIKLIGVYVGVSLAAMAAIARYKDRDAAEEEVRISAWKRLCMQGLMSCV